ncbi:MAG: dihydrodipicolinate synthase family protein [Chloroflexi bacterium]|nr:dihydrodipicolinate synthase family protein [Chloroflexota bacterium]
MNYRRSEAKEASRAQFTGAWAAITTPFTADLELDEAGLRRNMRHFTDDLHVPGIFCTGTMGEFWSLTKEERKRAVEIVVEEARGKCKVIAHTAAHSAHETVELTRHAEEVGADFAVMMNPYYPPCNEAMVYEWFKFVTDRVNIGVWMFETGKNGYAQYGFSPELTNRIADIENVCGIKLVRSLATEREHIEAVIRLCGDKIVVSVPGESDWLSLMKDYKRQVHMSSPSPYIYQTNQWQPLREYTELGLAGKYDEAAPISSQLDELRRLQNKWMASKWANQRVIPIQYLKAWCELLGMVGGPARAPLLPVTDEEKSEMRADLERAGLLSKVAVTA